MHLLRAIILGLSILLALAASITASAGVWTVDAPYETKSCRGMIAKETSLDELAQCFRVAIASRCNHSGDCPGSSLCRNGRCVKPNGDGTECDHSGECPGSSLCRNGRCEKHNGDGVECDHSGQCPGAEMCRNGRCQ